MQDAVAERALTFEVGGEALLGILHPSEKNSARGVLLVVGGPQYRVGSHRQFLLLARHLAAAGVPVLRFDYRGMGDSFGAQRDFEQIDADIRAAVDQFQQACPALTEVVIWGLCDAASAALFYAWQDERITGLVLLNPWVRTEEGLAKAYLKGYYGRRLLSANFWLGLVRGRMNPIESLHSLASIVHRVVAGRRSGVVVTGGADTADQMPAGPLPERMAACWRRYTGPILLILSGDDLTAAEFRDVATQSPAWRGLLDASRVTMQELPEANHTFARREWRDQVADWTRDWVLNLCATR